MRRIPLTTAARSLGLFAVWLRHLAGPMGLLMLALAMLAATVHAEIIENDPRIKLTTIEPARDVGYTVGDVLTRTVILEAPSNLTLFDTSIPIAGSDKKRRGKGSGIELRKVEFEKHPGVITNRYVLRLSYQVFTTAVTAKPAALPPEYVKFGGKNEKSFEFRIPSWSFRISPLAVFGSVDVEKDMSSFQGPLLLDATRDRLILYSLLGVLGISLLGLLYVLGTHAWMPRMGGPFARAYRDLKKLPSTDQGLARAIERLHRAIDTTAGIRVFSPAGLLERRPAFAPVRDELERFFGLSRTVFFEPSASHGIDDPMGWLKRFCRRCRDCERGLQ